MEKISTQAPGNRLSAIRASLQQLLVRGLLALLRGYQLLLSPLLGPRCRYYPSCSEYASQAIEQHGALAGSWLALKRVGRCHPGRAGGIDEVPAILGAQPARGKRDQRVRHSCTTKTNH